MGKWFLLLLVVLFGFSVFKVAKSFGKPLHQDARPVPAGGNGISVPVEAPASKPKEREYRILFSTSEVCQLEGVGILRSGARLPDGRKLVGWDSWSLVIEDSAGVRAIKNAAGASEVFEEWAKELAKEWKMAKGAASPSVLESVTSSVP